MRAEPGAVVLTFQESVQDPLFDCGLVYYIGSHLREDELPLSLFEAIPVVFNYWHAVLKKQVAHTPVCIAFFPFSLLNTKTVTLMCSLRMIWRTLGFISCSPKETTLLVFSATLLQTASFFFLTNSGVHERLSDALWVVLLFALEDGAGNKLELQLKTH